MRITSLLFPRMSLLGITRNAILTAGLAASVLPAHAQRVNPPTQSEAAAVQTLPPATSLHHTGEDHLADLSLPDSPSFASLASSSRAADSGSADLAPADPGRPQHTPPPGQPGSPLPRSVSPTELVIAAGQIAPRQNVGDKILSSLRSSVSPFSFTGEIIAASYSQVAASAPQYGQSGTGYAQRIGAAVARGTSQSIFTTAVMASVLHEDPRYYQLGRGHNYVNRGVYAVTRPFITRTDGGRQTLNLALLSGYLGAAALTPTYYPARNQGTGQVFSTYGTSLGGAALGCLVHEFLPEVLEAVHLK